MNETTEQRMERRQGSLLDRAIQAVAPERGFRRAMAREALHHFGYDGAQPGTLRGSSGSVYKNASPESWKMQRDRTDIMWDARDMERNFCLVGGILDRTSQYTCSRVSYQSRTGVKETDDRYEDYFASWMERADLTNRFNFRQLVELGFRAMLRDGDFGWCWREHGEEYRMQGIEADRIGNPLNQRQDENGIGGITINELGQPTNYKVFRRTRTCQYVDGVDVSPAHFTHLFRPTRPDQYRGVSWLASALPIARDLYELIGFERQAAKFASMFSGFLKPRDKASSGAMAWDTVDAAKGIGTMNAEAGKLLKMDGMDDIVFAPGTQRPSGAFMALVDAMIREMAIGLNLPYGFVYNMAVFGGVTARLEVMQAHRVIQRYQVLLQDVVLNDARNRVLGRAIARGKLPAHPGWRKGAWQFGPHITGDLGNQVQADIALMRSGIKTHSHLTQEYLGEDFEEVNVQQSREICAMRTVGAKDKVPVELLDPGLANASQLLASMVQPPQAGLAPLVGDNSVKQIVEIIAQAADGTLPRETAIANLQSLFGIDLLTASKMVPPRPTIIPGPPPPPKAPTAPTAPTAPES